ncbi:MAG: HNH endonuclease [Verrucomicrobia bacterium]|nr:HNH endonuclease [Verrucomicrobiota bacterium]
MPALSDHRLRAVLLSALPGATVITDLGHTKPMILSLPNSEPFRIYLWTTTPDASAQGRPAGEHKAQIILPGTVRGSTQRLNLEGMPTALLGYSPLFSVFTAWDASLHFESGYSKNLQFREELLEACLVSGWAVGDLRRTDNGPEVRVAVHPLHLPRYLLAMAEADSRHLRGEERRQFFISCRPPITVGVEQPAAETEIAPVGPRGRVTATRLSRSGTFGPSVLAEFGQTCAICQTQLRIVEGAHIIPIHDDRCRDEVWNGICLCRNHHRLFDLRIVRLNSDGVVGVETDDINYLRGLGVLGGFENVIQPFIGHTIRLPNFFSRDARLRSRFQSALATMAAG